MTSLHDILDLDAVEEEPPLTSFKFAGREWHIRAINDLPWSAMEEMFKQSQAEASDDAIPIRPFFEAALIEKDQVPFLKLLDAPGSKLTMKRVNLLMRHIMEKMFPGHPTTGSSDSSPGSETSAPTSTESSTEPVTPPKRSPNGRRSQSSTLPGRSSATTRSSKTA